MFGLTLTFSCDCHQGRGRTGERTKWETGREKFKEHKSDKDNSTTMATMRTMMTMMMMMMMMMEASVICLQKTPIPNSQHGISQLRPQHHLRCHIFIDKMPKVSGPSSPPPGLEF